MRRLVSVPFAVLLSLLLAGTTLASICGNNSKPAGSGQQSELWIDFSTTPPTVTVVNGNAQGHLRGGFVDVFLDFDGGGVDCMIDDTFIMSEHKIGHIATGQLFEGLGVLPAVHRGNDPGGPNAGAGFAQTSGACG
jgi:hypothetical protein